jgi:hypothetical protein
MYNNFFPPENRAFCEIISKNLVQSESFIKIRQVGAELFHADRRTGRRKEANSLFAGAPRKQKTLYTETGYDGV